MEWRPIEEAPRDRAILGWDGEDMAVVKWFDLTGYWTLVVCGLYAEDGEWWPTHWMELPEAPVG